MGSLISCIIGVPINGESKAKTVARLKKARHYHENTRVCSNCIYFICNVCNYNCTTFGVASSGTCDSFHDGKGLTRKK
jgi:hypothetical protein